MAKYWISNLLLGIGDIVSLNIAFLLAYLVGLNVNILEKPFALSFYSNILIFLNMLTILLFFIFNLYKQKRNLFDTDEFVNIVKALIFSFFIIISTTYIHKTTLEYSRFIFILMYAFTLILVTFLRIYTRRIIALLRAKGYNRKKVIIIGTNVNAKKVFFKIKKHKEWGYDFLGFVGNTKLSEGKVIGKLKDKIDVIKTKKPDVVFITLKSIKNNDLMSLIMKYPKIEFKVVPPIIEALIKIPDYDELKDMPLIVIPPSNNKFYLVLKRLLDVVVSMILIISLFPLYLIILILLLISGKPIFIQKRVGLNGKEFNLIKFRTMKINSEKKLQEIESINQTKILFKSKDDPRITLIGKLLRRTCIDELPQVFNVLTGDMSLVGPRPHLRSEIEHFEDWQKLRLNVKPGLTGLWQITGRHELDFNRSVALDLYYIKNMSFWLDIKILIKTIPSIIFSEGIW